FATGAAFLVLTGGAFAADPAAEPPVDVWSGYFVGLQGGYGRGENTTTLIGPSGSSPTYDMDGAFGGVYFGRNWQWDELVIGLESSISFADIGGAIPPSPDIVGLTVEGFSTSRLRLGYAVDNVLFFAAAGLSLARAEAMGVLVSLGLTETGTEWLTGFTVGGGVE